jgi:hypothetical protein
LCPVFAINARPLPELVLVGIESPVRFSCQ